MFTFTACATHTCVYTRLFQDLVEMARHGCLGCARQFATLRAAAQHARDKGHGVADESESSEGGEVWPEPPFDGAEGRWVDVDDFHGKKSFGYFRCPCAAWWYSAHAQRYFKQGCKTCRRWKRPLYMWVNAVHGRAEEHESGEKGPHLSALCGACKVGACSTVMGFVLV